MIVSHELKLIFLKTRKTAGTSIEIALSRFCGGSDIITPISPKDEKTRAELGHRGPQNFRLPLASYTRRDWTHLFAGARARYYNHMPAAEVRDRIGAEIWSGYFKFCVERNPWDKAISSYFWKTRKHEPRPSLLEYLRAAHPESLSNFEIYSIDGAVAANHVGKYEHLERELEALAARLGLPDTLRLPQAKGSFREDKRHYRDIMGEEERKIVDRICAREIEHFGYSF